MKIGVTGATGQLGRFVVDSLKNKVSADNIIALVRNPTKAAETGVEVRAFDYNTADATALEGIEKLLLISGSEIGQREQQHARVIAAAKAAGVKHIVYTSLLHADSSSLSLAAEHKATENILKNSGLAYTILRNGWYTENYTGSVGGAIAAGAFVGCAADGKISSAVRADFAEAAAVVLTSGDHVGKTYELSGDESYTLADLAAEISRQTGQSIPYTNLSETEYAQVLASHGVPEGFAAAIAGWDAAVANGDLFDNSRSLSKLIGRPTVSLAKAVADAIA
jgi:NAD(P)H dehydrogenase (quinone)